MLVPGLRWKKLEIQEYNSHSTIFNDLKLKHNMKYIVYKMNDAMTEIQVSPAPSCSNLGAHTSHDVCGMEAISRPLHEGADSSMGYTTTGAQNRGQGCQLC